MTTTSARPVDDQLRDDLDLVADPRGALASIHNNDFREACETDGRAHNGWVHPSRVSKLLHDRFGEINPNSLSAKWAGACGPNGFMDKTDQRVPIDPTHSRGNGNKDVRLRRLRGWSQ